MAILTVPSIPQLAEFTGRPEGSYTSFATAALLQATILFQIATELQPSDIAALQADKPEDYALAINGILAMADYFFLRQPFQAAVASPFISEHIGSYSFSKAQQEVARNAAALEVQGERTGVLFYDLAVQMLARRTRAGGVYFGQVTVFEEGSHALDPSGQAQLLIRTSDGAIVVVGPEDRDKIPFLQGVSGPTFPQDPGI